MQLIVRFQEDHVASGEQQWQASACILCESNCGITVQVEGRRLAKIRGDKTNPASGGYTCNKALQLDHYQNGGTRITSPLRREADGTYTEISWDVAVSEIANRLREVRDAHGGESIFFYGGGGQGNHLGGAYSGALLRAIGGRYRSNALAQEKLGEAWVDAHLTGGHTHGDFEHAQVSVFVGKNPWQSHGVPRARTVLQDISKNPARSMIVLDPVRSETADLADIHLQIKPGTDAWCLAAIIAVIVQEDLVDHDFLKSHVVEVEPVLAAFRAIDVGAYAQVTGVDRDLITQSARLIGTAESVATYEDLGVQQSPNSTLVSYLNKLTWLLTGNFAKRGAMQVHSWVVPLINYSLKTKTTPVTGTPMLGGLVPCNVIAEEILTDHPKRFRAMIVESSNPIHSLADSKQFGKAFDSLDLSIVIDVAMTETARRANYVLPAASQFEKWEATFFNLEFPVNTFQLRAPLMEALPGTLAEPEIYARIIRELGVVNRASLATLRTALRFGRKAYALAFLAVVALDKKAVGLAPHLLYETLGPTLPGGARSAAVLWALAHRVARLHPKSMRRAGHSGAEALFTAMLSERSGVRVTVDDLDGGAWAYVPKNKRPIRLAIPVLLDSLRALEHKDPAHTSTEFPFVLSAGERRAFTANTIFRDDTWRRRGASGALRINPDDAQRLGVADGGRVLITTTRGSATVVAELNDRMQCGHISLPNGLGLDLPGSEQRTGVAPNDLTDSNRRDEYSATPWHKHVPARVEAALQSQISVAP